VVSAGTPGGRGLATPHSHWGYGERSATPGSASSSTTAATGHSAGGYPPRSSGGGAATLYSRVKVAVRCRPPFAEEGTAASIVVLPPNAPISAPPPPGVVLADTTGPGGAPLSHAVHVEVAPGKRREFVYDVAFGPACGNADVYNVIGGPIVDGVLKGVNGTILAYGE
jgi:hypothetical protein